MGGLLSSPGNDSNRGGSNPLLDFSPCSWLDGLGSTEDRRRLVVNIVLAKNHGLEVPANHIDLAPRAEDTLAKVRRCDIGGETYPIRAGLLFCAETNRAGSIFFF